MGVLKGQVAVVTGAGQGIGAAVAENFAYNGAEVAVVDINEDAAKSVAAKIASRGGAATGFQCDVGVRASVDQASATIAKMHGRPTILVNNAGISRPAMVWKMTDEQWDDVIRVNLTGAFYWMQAVIPGMREKGSGRIIMTVSAAGILGSIGQINYAAAKAGMVGMTRSAAKELARYGILVNAVSPSAATPMTETIRTDQRFREKYLQDKLIRRWAEPSEIAATYTYLASDSASYMTGQVLSVDGGRLMVR